MTFTLAYFLQFLLCSYCVGWCMVGYHARKRGIVDLCQFVQFFIVAPLVTIISGVLLRVFWIAVLPNFWFILKCVASLIASGVVLGITGQFIVKPAVKKFHGVAKPFSDKICIVLYKR